MHAQNCAAAISILIRVVQICYNQDIFIFKTPESTCVCYTYQFLYSLLKNKSYFMWSYDSFLVQSKNSQRSKKFALKSYPYPELVV